MLYQEIFNHTSGFKGLLDLDGILRYVNDTALEFGGLAREEVVGKKFWETEWVSWSERVRQQVRADVQRAADGEFVRHDLEVQGKERHAVLDFAIHRFDDESGNETWLLPEGRDITQRRNIEGVSARVAQELSNDKLLVTYSRDRDEPMSQSIIEAFLALDTDIFGRDTKLEDWINSDAVNGLGWCSERPLTFMTRIWAYNVVLSDGEVRIYADA